MHYKRLMDNGTTELIKIVKSKCLIDDCKLLETKRGFCETHYRRWMKFGDAEHIPNSRASNGEPKKFFDELLNSETNDCIIWPYGKDGDGYGFIDKIAVHRKICFEIHGEPIGDANQAAHSCRNPSCVNKNHIRWATSSENMMDKHIHGTMPMGDKHWKRRN